MSFEDRQFAHSKKRGAVYVTACAICFFCGTAVMGGVLGQLARTSPTATSGSMEWMREHQDEVEFLVIGPSYVRLHFLPDEFEQELREAGHELYSFGYSGKALLGAETDHYIREILKFELPRLRYVLIDVTLKQRPRLGQDNWWKRRSIQWHSPRQFHSVLTDLTARDLSPLEHGEQIWGHFLHTLLRSAQVGEGVFLIENSERFGAEPRHYVRSDFHANEGLRQKQANLQRRYRKNREAYHKSQVKALIASRNSRNRELRDNRLPAQWRRLFEDRGVEVRFLLSPDLNDVGMETDVAGAPPLLFLDFNDPVRYPELYGVELRYDSVHLIYDAALVFTRELAREVLPMLDGREG